MGNLKYYFRRIKYRLMNLRGGWDYLLVFFTVWNLYTFSTALMVGNMVQVAISGILLAFCVKSLID
jgi:hypothetical protein